MTHIVVIENDLWQIGLVPSTGGSVAFGRVRLGGTWVDVLRPTPDDKLTDVWQTASFPLVPWSNRVAEGLFSFGGKNHQLRVNFADGTAIHGTGIEFPWDVVESSPTAVTLEFDSRKFAGVNWPWHFTSRFGYALEGDRFVWHMAVTNVDTEPFPAGLGHHPYFEREIGVGGAAQLQLNCGQVYPAVGCIPTGPAQDLDARVDFRQLRPLGTEFVDDCWTARSSSTIATVEYPGALTLDVEAGALLEHAVVYIPQGETIFALEAVTNANNGFNLEAQGASGTGVFVLQPGETKETSFTLVAQPHA